jgi:hypothetical protein
MCSCACACAVVIVCATDIIESTTDRAWQVAHAAAARTVARLYAGTGAARRRVGLRRHSRRSRVRFPLRANSPVFDC